MKTTINIAILGCGTVSRFHAKAIRQIKGARLIGAASRSQASVQEFCEEFKEARGYDSYEKLLSDPEIDVVSICTPSGDHCQQAIMALEAGKSVIIEKPICLSLKDADTLIKLAREKGLSIAIISQSRFTDAAQAIKNAIDSNQLGKIVSASLMMRYSRTQAYYDSASWRGTRDLDGGGILMNQGIHGIDLLCHFLGRPASVTGYVKTQLRNIEVEDTACAAVEFRSGAIATIDATVCSTPPFAKRFIIGGEKGTIILEDDAITLWSLPTPCPLTSVSLEHGGSASDPKAIAIIYHQREYENIIAHLLGKDKLLIDAEEGRVPLSVILGIYESSRTGRHVQV